MDTETNEQPRSHATLKSALVAAQRRVKAVAKKAKNAHHGYNYASADAIIDEASEALAAEGLAVLPVSVGRDPEQPDHVWTGEGDDAWIITPRRIKAVYRLIHDGSDEEREFASSTPVIPEKGRPEDKAEFGARTENLGYALRDLLLIPREDQAAQTPSARDDRSYQQRGPAQQPPKAQPSAAPPARPQQQQAKPEVKTVGGPAPAMPETPRAQQTTISSHGNDRAEAAGTIEKPASYTEEQDKRISTLFKQLRDMGAPVSGPGASAYVVELTGHLRSDLTVADGNAVIADLERKIAAKELWLKKPVAP